MAAGNRKVHKVAPATLEREAQVISLRTAGATFEDIGRTLGVSYQRAHQIYDRALERRPAEKVAELRLLESSRYERLLRAWWPLALGTADVPPDPEAARVVLRLLRDHARLMGLPAPIRVDVEIVGPSHEQRVETLATHLEAFLAGADTARSVDAISTVVGEGDT